jgi:hypothetical protein
LIRGRPAEAPLVLVDRLPAAPRDELGHPRPQPRLVGGRRRVRQPTAGKVFEQPRDRVGGALLVRADDPRRPALDPAHRVLARARRAVLLADPAAVVADQAPALVERHSGQRPAEMADRPDHEPARDDLLVTGRYGATVFEPVVDHTNPGHGPVSILA